MTTAANDDDVIATLERRWGRQVGVFFKRIVL
jgi:hypothetical protein